MEFPRENKSEKGLISQLKSGYKILRAVINSYNRDGVTMMGAALSYYMVFSLPAILIIATASVGIFFGEEAVAGQILNQLGDYFGAETALEIQSMIIGISDYDRNIWATIMGIGLLIFGASGVFYALQTALNKIFGVQNQVSKGILDMLVDRGLSFGMVVVICFIMVFSLSLNTALLKLSYFMASHQGAQLAVLNWFGNLSDSVLLVFKNLTSFILFTIFFAFLYRVLPNVNFKWRQIWLGAVLTAVLFGLGELLLGFYLSKTDLWTTYGAAGSLVVILIWVYYTAQMLFVGAEFIKVYSYYKGYPIVPRRFVRKEE